MWRRGKFSWSFWWYTKVIYFHQHNGDNLFWAKYVVSHSSFIINFFRVQRLPAILIILLICCIVEMLSLLSVSCHVDIVYIKVCIFWTPQLLCDVICVKLVWAVSWYLWYGIFRSNSRELRWFYLISKYEIKKITLISERRANIYHDSHST